MSTPPGALAPAPAGGARRGRVGADTRARIEAAAVELFARKGVDGTSVRDIAEKVGVSEGALYRHFSSKDELARELFLTRYAALAREICAIEARSEAFGAKVAAVVELACRMFDAEPALFAYLLIHQHAHLAHVPQQAEANVVEAVARLMRGAGVPSGRVGLASALALGCVVQPAVFTLYGRIERPLIAQAGAIAAAVMAIVEQMGGR